MISSVRKVTASYDVFIYPFIFLICLVGTIGCSRTVVTQEFCYPPGSDFRTADHRIVIASEGSPGRAYADFGQKKVRVTLFGKSGPQSTNLFNITAGNLGWTVNWVSASNISIEFCDESSSQPRRSLKTLHLNTALSRQSSIIAKPTSSGSNQK